MLTLLVPLWGCSPKTAPTDGSDASASGVVSVPSSTSSVEVSTSLATQSDFMTGTTSDAVDGSSSSAQLDDSSNSTLPEGSALPDAGVVFDGGQGTVSCDQRNVLCKRLAPNCDFGFVPRVVNNCYGECVAIDACVCDEPQACPYEERYTCNNSRSRCTPYLN